MRWAKGVVGLLTAALVLLSVGPLVLPFQVFPVLSSSMEPAIPAGSEILVTRVPASQLRVGDVITFQPPGQTGFVTSRVYALRSGPGGPIVQTRADAGARPDPWRLSLQGSGWRATGSVPLLGYPLAPLADPAGRLLLVVLLGAALAGLFLFERRGRLRPTRQRTAPRSMIAIGALLLLTVPATFAAFLAKTTNAASSFTNVALVSPTAPTASYTPSTVVLNWTAASPMNGNGYALSAVNNGASSSCPAAVASYTTWVGGTASTTLTDLGSIAQGTPGTYACYLIQAAYNPAGAPPWGSVPVWTSQTSLATVAVLLGVQSVRVGAESAPSFSGTVTATLSPGSAAGDLLVMNINELPTATQSTAPAGWVYANGVNNAAEGRNEIWYYPSAPATSSVTFTIFGAGATAQLSEWKNVSTASPLDKTGTDSASATASTTVSTSAGTTLANELVIVNAGYAKSAGVTVTPAAGWTSMANDTTTGYAAQYRWDRPAGVISETLSSAPATNWSIVIATFK